MLTQVGVKQLTDFLRTVTAASDLVDCTLVNCDLGNSQVRVYRTIGPTLVVVLHSVGNWRIREKHRSRMGNS